MNVIAKALEVGHPAAYLLIFLILGIPLTDIIISIGMCIYDKIKEKVKK